MKNKYTRKHKKLKDVYITKKMKNKFDTIVQKASKSQDINFNYEAQVLDPFMKSIQYRKRNTKRRK